MSNATTSIKQTLAAYCHRVDLGNAEEVAELFAEDAVLKPYYDGKYEVSGRSGIRDWYAFYHDNLRAGVRHLKHLIHSIEIDVNGSEATSVCYLTAYFISKEDGIAYQVQGTYHDVFVDQGGSWLFKERQIDVEFLTSCGEPIEEMTPMNYPGASS